MGGYIALRSVAKYPKRISALILPDTQCIADTDEGKERRYKTISQIEQFGLDAYAEASLKNLFYEKSFANKKDEVEKIKQTILGTSPATVIAALKALAAREESCSVLGEINIPTLIICGAEDKITPLAQAEFLKQNIANSSLEIIEGAAHVTNLEQPEIFNSHLENFLNGL
jgi:pimeloyl-ACP methyl ester carboxylesterase